MIKKKSSFARLSCRYTEGPRRAKVDEEEGTVGEWIMIALGLALLHVWRDLHQETTVRLVDCYDGDTCDFATGANPMLRVRLAGIDAPEREQTYGHIARRTLLEQLTAGAPIRLDKLGVDRYGRTLALIHVGSQMVNRRMIAAGMAEAYLVPGPWRESFGSEQHRAKEQRLGMWSQDRYLSPQQYRRKKQQRKIH